MTDPRPEVRPEPARTDLATRYGRRRRNRRPLVLVAVGLLAAVGLAWLGWVAFVHSSPPVASRLIGYEVRSATTVTATIEVERTKSIEAACRLQAKAADFSIVGEATVTVAADTPRRQLVTVEITTQRRPTAVVLVGCTTAGTPRPR